MPRYYFDIRDDETLTQDDVGIELPSIGEAKVEAATALAEIAKEVFPASAIRTIAFEVRDDRGPVLGAALRFDIHQQRA
jgi:hypothetical protein